MLARFIAVLGLLALAAWTGGPALARGNLASRPTEIKLDIKGDLTMSAKEFKLETGKYYKLAVTVQGGDEFRFMAPDMWLSAWINQVVIAGNAAAVARAMELAKAAGAKRAVSLPVSAPFHCPLMKPAQDRLKADLDATAFADLRVPLINNWQAKEVRTGVEAREGLFQQVPNPVRWSESVRLMASLGVTRAVEVGAGAVLTGLLKQIEGSIAGTKFGEAADLEKVSAASA